MCAYDLTDQQKADALILIMTLKEKRDGTVKGRGVCGGHKDRGKTTSDEATSPTAITESLYRSLAIGAFDRRFVEMLDIPSAYFHARAEDRITSFVVLDGVLVDLYLQVDPSEVTYNERGKKLVYTKMKKALYGHMMAVRLFLEHLSKSLIDIRFVPNPDDLYVLILCERT